MNIIDKIKASPFPVSITACAGTGKTHTIIEVIKHLVENKNVNPENIVLQTFTKDAALEMTERLPASCVDIKAGTIHAIMLQIDKKHYHRPVYVLDEPRKNSIAYKICKKHKINYEQSFGFFMNIGYMKNTIPDYYQFLESGILPYTGKHEENFYVFAKAYQAEIDRQKKADFDDILLIAYNILKNQPEVCQYYRNKWKYLFVDEGQDLSPVQSEIIKLLTINNYNLFIVSDSKQAIYQFRGSSSDFLSKLPILYPNIHTFSLPTTFRCAEAITEASNKVASFIDNSQINTFNKTKGNIIINTEFDAFSDEVDYIVDNAVNKYVDTSESIKILFRTNAQALLFQGKLLDLNIPFSTNINNNIFNTKEIQAALSACRLVFEFDNLPVTSQIKVIKMLKKLIPYNKSWYAFVYDLTKFKVNPFTDYKPYKKYIDIINDLYNLKTILMGSKTPYNVFNLVLSIIEAQECKAYTDNEINNIVGVSEFVRRCKNMNDVDNLIAKISKPRSAVKTERVIYLGTVHSAKGLEADNVYVAGVSDGLFPLKAQPPEDELNLFYVAITRAKYNLYITGCQNYGNRKFNSHSYASLISEQKCI